MFDLNDETREILGRPNFACGAIARRLREMGHSIETKAEDEQAAVIHWLLCLYEQHGTDKWRDEGERILRGDSSPSGKSGEPQ